MSKETMKTNGQVSYEAPESTVFRVTAERNILTGSNPGSGEIEVPGEEPGEN